MGLFKPRYLDGQTVDIEGLAVRLRISPRARRISLRIDRASGEAVAVAPDRARLGEAAGFARERRAWLLARLREIPAPRPPPAAGDEIAVLGETWRLAPDGRRPRLDPDAEGERRRLRGCGDGAVDPMLVTRVVRREAQAAFERRAEVHCQRLGTPRPPIRLIDARSRWGSCTPAGPGRPASIRLSWRLAFAPIAVADYVVAHECAHLLEANHGPRFWALVRRLVGDPAPHRAWLRKHGASLHAFLRRPAASEGRG
jgi:predicted metal-dependent hydrolase